ncbi:DDB1- and CUL4-associated factor 8 isoform X2 [Drosophila ficusphila]|uniref:DDB1- and CUL4-associated factor 8 isoform X2 n=1 Tax=Drosophila ficusphila TaxID=30025 RepID=UPI0007E7EC0C|nr:DDB1- and CUL4-associated factor 8 isoform X2 [Drosophila ficusphila]
MDVEEGCGASEEASACKRQRRNTDSRDDGQLGDAAQVGEEKTVTPNLSVINSTITSNNNNEEGDMLGVKQSLKQDEKISEVMEADQAQQEKAFPEEAQSEDNQQTEQIENPKLKEEQPEKEPLEGQLDEEQAGSSYRECQLSPHAASAVLANNKPKLSSGTTPIDSDDDPPTSPRTGDASPSVTSPRFNHRNIPATRSYRRISVELVGTITDSDSSYSLEPDVQDETEEAEVDSDAQPAADAADEPVIIEDLSSDSSSSEEVVHRYDLSSEIDSSSEGDLSPDPEASAADREKVDFAVDEVMCKYKPKYTWNCAQELMHREHNIINRIGWRGGHTSTQSFGQGYYGSRQVVEQLTQLSSLNKHNGCVNCLNFNRAGDLVCSGSDDLHIIVWDWANDTPVYRFRSGHTMNIFQTKFIDSAGCLDIVSASRDGQVRRAVIPPSGGAIKPVRLYSHSDSVHKIVLVPQSRHEVMSAGEDASVKHFDLRTSNSASVILRNICHDGNERRRVRLFSIAHHPYAPEFCVSGSDDKLRVYDKRSATKPILEMSPTILKENKITQITCAVYNHSGSEILASYSDAGIYLFDSRNNKDGEYLHCYEGHINSRTIKGVNFFGPRSEYIVSGSDCGNIFFWDRNTEAIINYMKGDHAGVVNCLEPHPWMPVLATSGLEHDVKIWTPNGPNKSDLDEATLKHTLQRNFRRNIVDRGDFDGNQFQYFIRQFLEPSRRPRLRRPSNPNSPRSLLRQDGPHWENSSSTSNDSSPSNPASQRRSSNSSDDANGEGAAAAAALDTLHCRTQ